MSTQSDAARKAELAKWLIKVNPDMAKDLAGWEKKHGNSIQDLKDLMYGLEQLGDEKALQSDKAYTPLAMATKRGGTIADLLNYVQEVIQLWHDPAKVPQAVSLWGKVRPIVLGVLAEGEKSFDSDGFASARAAITRIGKALEERAAAAAKAAADAAKAKEEARKPRNDRERIDRLEQRGRGHTKVDIALIGAKVLQKQYDAMLMALENAKSARVSEIDSWQPSQTPMGGNLVLKISKGLATAAGVAFPEVAFLEIATKGIEIAIKGKEQLDKKAEASKDEAEELKKRAREELDKLMRHTRAYVATTQDKLQKLIEAAAEKLGPDELDALQGTQEPQLVTNFVKEKLGIARGTDVDSGVITAMQTALLNEFNAWVKEDYKTRKLGQASLSVARDGGNSWDAMDLRALYDLKKHPNAFNPNELKETLEAYDQKHNKPAGWAEAQLKKLEEKLDKDFEEDFASDSMRSVPAKND